jgi:replicative DNA helicase
MSAEWQAAEAEKVFIGSILVNPSRLMEVKATSTNFMIEAHSTVFDVIMAMNNDSSLVDLISVSDRLTELNSRDKGNTYSHHPSFTGGWLHQLSNWMEAAFAPSFFYSSQEIIIREFRKREIARISYDLSQNYDADEAIQSLMALEVTQKKYTHTLTEAITAAIDKVQRVAESGGLVGLTTGLTRLDDCIGGFQPSDLYIVGARPAMGKTALAINFMLSNNCAAGFFSTEQPMEQIGIRTLSIKGGVSASKIRKAKIDHEDAGRLIQTSSQVQYGNVLIHDKSNITIGDIMREGRKMKFDHDIKIIYVDYLQRIRNPKSESRRLEVADVAIGLKTLARELDIPVVALAQVNREVDKRVDKRPKVGDLTESGVIESEADAIIMLYRDEVYNKDTADKGIMEALIEKNRHGPIGGMKFAWMGDLMKVGDLYE